MPVRKSKPASKSLKKSAPLPKARAKRIEPLDLSAFPPESVTVIEKQICLACVLDIFTRHLGIAARTAHLEIKKYTPTIEELSATAETRPWFVHPADQGHCPYCGSAASGTRRFACIGSKAARPRMPYAASSLNRCRRRVARSPCWRRRRRGSRPSS